MDDQKLAKINLDTSENDKLILSSIDKFLEKDVKPYVCLLYTSPSPRDRG